mmetsp:Transcript_66582/g.210513  ORF Transcript_66582/g.210513 Transcript_66582/m.210513 type:complete len:1029 (+) Transcript_66582:106-3192(+)
MQAAASADARSDVRRHRGKSLEKPRALPAGWPPPADECEKENEHSPGKGRTAEWVQRPPELVQFYKGDELQQCFDAPAAAPGTPAALEAVADDPHTIARLAQLQVAPDSSEAFEVFARDLCGRYRCAWRGARRMLSQHLENPADMEPMLQQAHPGEPSDADICCYFARMQPSQAQASKWLAQALRFDPNCSAALIALADEHRRAERFSEAAHLYRSALQQRQLPVRSLYRLGEVLVQSGKGSEGRGHLRRVLLEADARSYHVHAAVTMALSYAMDQRHEDTLQCCQRAEELHEHLGLGSRRSSSRELRLVRTMRALSQLRMGDPDAAVETLRMDSAEASASSSGRPEAGWHWDEMVQSLIGHAETLRGNYRQAERHLDSALRLVEADAPGADVLVSAACLRQAQGDLEDARELLQRALQADRNSPAALLRMGYLLLCQGQFEKAAQFLQKCLLQPTGTLAYGSAEKGAAHLYLCLALHWRWSHHAVQRSPRDKSAGDRLAQDHFRSAYELQPDLRKALLALQGTRFESNEAAAALLVSGNPSRMGIVDLQLRHALVVLLYAEECGAVRLTRRRKSGARRGTSPVKAVVSPVKAAASPLKEVNISHCWSSPIRAATSPLKEAAPRCGAWGSPIEKAASPLAEAVAGPTSARASAAAWCRSPDLTVAKPPPPVGSSCCGGSLVSTLAATASTATPTSVSSSRTASELALFPDVAAAEAAAAVPEDLAAALQDLSERLPLDKVIPWSDVSLEKCVSRGEFAIVNRGRLRRPQREVVVKMMHQKDCMYNEQAARDLLAEIRILSELSHPRVVAFAGACLEPAHIALVTELAPGGNLHHALHVRRHSFPLVERFQLAIQLLEGVRYLHNQRPTVAHLDLKSSNLVLDADSRHLQICDFGLARVMQEEVDGEPQEPPPSQGGSARYMAPECYDSKLGPVTEKADVWSSGCILIEIFGSCLPYAECSNVQQILKNMLVHRCGPSIPATIEANVRGAIAFTFVFEVRERLMVSQVLVLLQTAASSAESRVRLSRTP